jgi:hypothetical protein
VPMSVLVWGFALMIWRLLVVGYHIAVLGETDVMLGDEGREALEQYQEATDGNPEKRS